MVYLLYYSTEHLAPEVEAHEGCTAKLSKFGNGSFSFFLWSEWTGSASGLSPFSNSRDNLTARNFLMAKSGREVAFFKDHCKILPLLANIMLVLLTTACGPQK